MIGVDLTPAMIEKARRVAEAIGLRNTTFHVSDMIAIPVADASVGMIICFW